MFPLEHFPTFPQMFPLEHSLALNSGIALLLRSHYSGSTLGSL